MTILMALPKEILDTIEQIKAECEILKKENGLTAFGEGQLQLANILIDILHEWRKDSAPFK